MQDFQSQISLKKFTYGTSFDCTPILLIVSKPFHSKILAVVNFLCFWKSLLMPGSTVNNLKLIDNFFLFQMNSVFGIFIGSMYSSQEFSGIWAFTYANRIIFFSDLQSSRWCRSMRERSFSVSDVFYKEVQKGQVSYQMWSESFSTMSCPSAQTKNVCPGRRTRHRDNCDHMVPERI